MEWILASASPRRKELLKELIDTFEIIPAQGEENAHGLTGAKLVETLAAQKVEEVASRAEAQGKAVLGADTIVCLDGEVLGKPKDEADAKRMLSMLSSKVHQVYTGVCIILPSGEKMVEADCTDVAFEALTETQIEAYIATGSPMDKAGAYGIQDGGIVKEIRGSYSNVVGFPCELFAKLLESVK
jgi:septum formation protein